MAGRPSPLGVSLRDGGINVAVVSRHATAIFLCLYDEAGEDELYRFRLPARLGDVHFGFIAGVGEGTRYGFRVEGPWDASRGLYFDSTKLLVDPYARQLDRPFHHVPELLERGIDTGPLVPKGIVRVPPAPARPLPPHSPRFIYELPVKAFTMRHPAVPEALRGTVKALAEPAVISHLTTLGVDTVELMPLMAWIDERHLTALGLANGWGYNPVTFMAPDPRLAPGGFADIRQAVDALHAADIRVVLDVVFNHTGESDEGGTTLSLGGLDNALYYKIENGLLVNDTGCGNTIACDRPAVIQLVLDAMRCWVEETGLDGFRFDLATVLGHTPDAPLLAAMMQDPLLKDLILIAEPWDLSTYRLGGFPAPWLEWNDRYRDDVRRFWRGDGSAGALATRVAGSSDIFGGAQRPLASVNFVAAHDGFTLADVTRYAVKNNFANGEDNRDGNSGEVTWLGGDVRALLATLFFSRGTPMLTAGDEFGRSQKGNNNAYAQDNDLTWLDWAHADTALTTFVAQLVTLRKQHPALHGDRFFTGSIDPETGLADADWRGVDGGPMRWDDGGARILGLLAAEHGTRIGLWFNGSDQRRDMLAAARPGFRWVRLFTSGDGEGLPLRSVSLFVEEQIATAGIDDLALARLAVAAGISTDWWEVDGTHHDVPPDTLRHILTGLGLAHGSLADVRDGLQRLKDAPRTRVARADHLSVLAEADAHRRRFTLTYEDGRVEEQVAAPGEALQLTLPAGLHTLRGDAGVTTHVIASPGACFVPDEIGATGRVFGLASHLYALRHGGDGGIGDFETLRRFTDLTHKLGGRYAGINPLHHMFPTDRNRVSPYQPSDRRFVDPIYINIAQLLERGRLPKTAKLAETRRAAFVALEALTNVDYAAHWAAKSELLESAFLEFGRDDAFDAFISAGGEALKRHGRFEAARAGEKATPARIRYRAFLQFIADQQLAKAATHGSLYRDLALGCAYDGGEMVDGDGGFVSTISLGAPPDPFSKAGQVWNLPGHSPLALDASGLAPLRKVLAANMAHAGALRIDHILGFARQFWVPRGAEGKDGAYVAFPMESLIALTALESQRHQCLVVGEDLGTIPDGLREALTAAAIFSYKVLWFEREQLGFKPAAAYPRAALACLASHDLPTFVGWRRGRDIAIDQDLGFITPSEAVERQGVRQREIAALDAITGNTSPRDDDASIAAHGFVAGTASAMMLIQADDLAGETEPLNVPGTDTERPNWRRRIGLTVDELGAKPLTRNVVARVKRERGLV